MAKTNFTKAEQLFDEGLLKMSVQGLLELADLSASFGKLHVEKPPSKEIITTMLQTIHKDVEKLVKHDQTAYEKMGISKEELQKYFDNPASVTLEEWEKVRKIREKILIYKSELRQKLPQSSNEELIESERHKHINKRFNVSDNWLPLK